MNTPAVPGPAPALCVASRPPLDIGPRIRPELGLLAGGTLLLAAPNALGLAIPWLLKGAIDSLRGLQANPGRATGDTVHLITVTAALIAGTAVAQAVARTFSRVLIFNAGRNVEYQLRQDLFWHLCRMDPGFFRRNSTGDVMSRMTNDLSAVRMLFGPGILNVVNTAIVYVTGLWLLVHLSHWLTLVEVAT